MALAGSPGRGPDNLVEMQSDGHIQVRLYGGVKVASDASININEWHLVDFGCDGTSAYFYIDGVLQSNSPTPGAYNRETELWFGSRPDINTGPYYFDGSVDDVRIYDRALSTEEILAIKNLME